MMRAVNIAVTFVLLCCNVRVGALKPNLSISSFCAGNTYDVDAKKDDTVGGVCSALCKVNKLNANKQSVLYDGRVLDKKKTLQQLGVADGESLSIEPTRDLKLKSVRKEGIKRQPKTLLKKSSYQHRNEDLSKPTSRNNRVGNIKKPSESTWDLSGLRRMIQRGGWKGITTHYTSVIKQHIFLTAYLYIYASAHFYYLSTTALQSCGFIDATQVPS